MQHQTFQSQDFQIPPDLALLLRQLPSYSQTYVSFKIYSVLFTRLIRICFVTSKSSFDTTWKLKRL